MVHLPFYYLKLVHSVLRIIPWVCMINRILNSIHHLIIVSGHVLLCEVGKRLESTYWVIVWHIPLVSVVVHIVNSYSSSIDTLKLIHACIVFCMITFCFWCPRINRQVVLCYNMSWTLRWLINLYLIELLLIFWRKKILLIIIIDISLVSSRLHRPGII